MPLRSVVAIASLAIAGIVIAGWLARAPIARVEVAAARASRLTVRVTTNGVIEPIDKAEIRARLDGRVIEIPKAGDELRTGELLLKIDAAPAKALLADTESQRLAALESLREAEQALRRTLQRAEHDRRLFRDQALTQERLDESLADLAEAEAKVAFLSSEVPLRVASLDLRIAELRAKSAGSEVRAQFDGTVYRAAAKPGQRVRSGDPVVWFADLARPRVRVNVDQVDLGRVKVGQPVQITSNAYPEKSWSARIEQLIPNVVKKESRRVAEALAEVEAPASGLLPGMSVDVEIAIKTVSDAIQVPSEAIYTDELGAFVYRVDGDRVNVTRVAVGRSGLDSVEIMGGLAAQDRVVVGRAAGLRDGERIDAALVPAVGARDGD